MTDIVIATAEVIALEKVVFDTPKILDKYGAGLTSDGYGISNLGVYKIGEVSNPAGVVPSGKKEMVVSKLKITGTGKTVGFTTVEGIMTLPMQLPFGKVFELTLHDPGTGVMDNNDRLFKDEENAG